jgi:hypothetical protein
LLLLRAFLALLTSFLALPMNVPESRTEDPGFELDHFFVAVAGPDAGAAALESAGFQITAPQPHPGQGTASRGVIFENAYLELIWLADRTEAESPQIQRTRLADRLRSGSSACPFGLGLRRAGEESPAFAFDTWDYSPPYLPEGMSFQMASSSEALKEPLVFYLPWVVGSIDPGPGHSNGARKVTGLEILLPWATSGSKTVQAVSQTDLVSFREGEGFQMVVELDDGNAGKSLDLRPDIPLRIQS